jgi:CubicO group peptidase (beta-lactamase class C family)
MMKRSARLLPLLLALGCTAAPPQTSTEGFDAAKLAALKPAFEQFAARKQASGTVTLVGRGDRIAHLEAVGFRDLEASDPMRVDSLFQIASMTKPITALAVMMLQEEGRLSIDDPVEKILPEFRGQQLVKSREGAAVTLGKPARPITVKDLLTHTSGLNGGMPPGFADLYSKRDRTLAEVVPAIAARPLEFEPGTKWAYCNAGIDTLGRIVEVRSGKSFEAFLEERLFGPLGMKDTFFYPRSEHLGRIAKLYKKSGEGIAPSDGFLGSAMGGRFPLPAGGLYSTAPDLFRLYRMLLAGGQAGGRRYVSAATLAEMTRNQTGDLRAGFTDGIGMGLGFQVVVKPVGVTEMLSPGTYGHGGAFGTQGWIDPARKLIFILMVQRSGFPNGDASDLRRELQTIATGAQR